MSDFGNIWISLADRFYKVAWYLLGSETDAEDAVQELYLKLWSTRDSLCDVRNPAAYGISMLKNICIDRIRRGRSGKVEPLEKAPPLEAAPPERRTEMKDILRHLMDEMDKLPQKQREVLKMRAIEELEYEEIAERTGLSQVHVRVLMTMARKTLKQKLKL